MAAHPGRAQLVAPAGELGFRRRAGLVFTRGDGLQVGWLGLNTASRSGIAGQMLVNPVVGVRHRQVEEWVARGRGEKLHPYLPPTISEPLRYLAPSNYRRDWILDGSGSDGEVVDDLMGAVATAGLAFIDKLGDLLNLVGALGGVAERDQNAAYRWPVALLLSGQREAASEAAAHVRSALGRRTDPAAQELREFLSWFEGEVTIGG